MEYQLIIRCKNGDKSAFEQLIKNYKDQLFSYLVRLSESREAAEDLFQETLIKVWTGLPAYREKSRFSSWLFAIAHNLAMDSYRKKKVRRKINDDSDDLLIYSKESHIHEYESREIKMIIMESLKMLPEKQRNVFLLRQHGELSFKEIAEITNQPLNTVLSHMHYAVKKLRIILRDKNVI